MKAALASAVHDAVSCVPMVFCMTSTKSFGSMMLSMSIAFANRGAISAGEKAAMPHPTLVTRNVYSRCAAANWMNWSTYGLMASVPPCIVGIA